jgi:hypothetical protein
LDYTQQQLTRQQFTSQSAYFADPAAARRMPPKQRRMLVLSPDQIMAKGLDLIGYNLDRKASVGRKENEHRFTRAFGSHPIVYTALW